MPRIFTFHSSSIFKYNPHQASKKIFVLPTNSRLDYANFFYYLPNDFSCIIKSSTINSFKFRLNIYRRNIMLFHIPVDEKFMNYCFYLDAGGYSLNWSIEYQKENQCYFCSLFFDEHINFGTKEFTNKIHPYVVIGKKFLKLNNYEMNDFLSLFSHSKLINIMIKKRNNYLQLNFETFLRNNFHGDFIVYLSGDTNLKQDRLMKFDDKHKVFGISWNFPWTYAALQTKFQCFMADTTFKCMKPYTLTLFTIIISNESIPICVSIFPTETFNSYQRLYLHLKEILIKFSSNFDFDSNQKRIVCDLGSGLKKFALTNNFDLKYCHRHLIEKYGSSSIFGNWVSRIIKTNTYDEFLIIRNIIIKEVLIRYPNSVYRHITFDEYFETNQYNVKLLHKLFDLLGVHLLNNKENKMKYNMWAKWNRYGCPTTSNSIESINMHLNQNIPHKGTFFNRLKNVETVLKNRFMNFENKFGNNFTNYVENLKNKQSYFQTKVGECKCGQYLYYSSLFNYDDTPCIHTINDYIAKFNNTRPPMVNLNINPTALIQDNIRYENVQDILPESWINTNKYKNSSRRDFFIKKEIKELSNPDQKFNISWDIIYSIKYMIPKKDWQGKKQEIISYVLNLGQTVDINNTDQLAYWRMNAYGFAGI